MTALLALCASLVLTEHAFSDVADNVLSLNEFGTVGISTVGRIWCCQLLNFEIELFDILLGQHSAAGTERDRYPTATRREQRRVGDSIGEEVYKTGAAVRMLALQSERILDSHNLHASVAFREGL